MKVLIAFVVVFLLPSIVAQTPTMCSALNTTPDDVPVSSYRGCNWSKKDVEEAESRLNYAKASQIPELSYADYEAATKATIEGYQAQPIPPIIEWTDLEPVAPCASGKMVVITPIGEDGQGMEAFKVALVLIDCTSHVLYVETQGYYAARALEMSGKAATIPLEP